MYVWEGGSCEVFLWVSSVWVWYVLMYLHRQAELGFVICSRAQSRIGKCCLVETARSNTYHPANHVIGESGYLLYQQDNS